MKDSPSQVMIKELTLSFDYFNGILFDNKLKDTVILLHRKSKALGYFCPTRWDLIDKETEEGTYHELALNPDWFKGRSLEQSLSTLVHEMTHLEQHLFGKPSKNGYHNKEWADMMKIVGLIASNTGKEEGSKTGIKMTHYIQSGGRFEVACKELLATKFKFSYQSIPKLKTTIPSKRVTYKCTQCNISAQAEEGIAIICANCDIQLLTKKERKEKEK